MLVMKPYLEMTTEELTQELDALRKEYKKVQAMDMQLNMSRGIPCIDQLDLSMQGFPASISWIFPCT